MFGSIGGFEMLVLAIIGLLVFGPRKLPEIGRTVGKALVEFRRATMELRTSIEREINLEELRETTATIKKAVGADLLDGVPRVGDILPKPADLLPPGGAAGVIPALKQEAASIVKEVSEPGADKKPDSGQGPADVTVRS